MFILTAIQTAHPSHSSSFGFLKSHSKKPFFIQAQQLIIENYHLLPQTSFGWAKKQHETQTSFVRCFFFTLITAGAHLIPVLFWSSLSKTDDWSSIVCDFQNSICSLITIGHNLFDTVKNCICLFPDKILTVHLHHPATANIN